MTDLRDLLKLPVAERLQLISDLWDSLEAETDGPPLTEDQEKEIERRLADLEANPNDVLEWSDVRARLWSKVK
jgi:putative addiction module component (TIGR02574 family)